MSSRSLRCARGCVLDALALLRTRQYVHRRPRVRRRIDHVARAGRERGLRGTRDGGLGRASDHRGARRPRISRGEVGRQAGSLTLPSARPDFARLGALRRGRNAEFRVPKQDQELAGVQPCRLRPRFRRRLLCAYRAPSFGPATNLRESAAGSRRQADIGGSRRSRTGRFGAPRAPAMAAVSRRYRPLHCFPACRCPMR
jgi:hypothetical protein